MLIRLLVLLIAIFQAPFLATAEQQATPPSSIHVREGYQVQLLRSAGEGEGSWISMSFDEDGSIILAREDHGLLRWTPGDSSSTAILQPIPGTEDLKHCRGVLCAYDSIYVSETNGKGIYRLRDLDRDGNYEDRRLLCQLTYKSRYGHGANQITLGPDGHLLIAIGNDVEIPPQADPMSPYRHPRNDWLLPNPNDGDQDDRVGYILQTDANGDHWTVLAGGLRNQVDVAFNRDGEMFTWDADMEWDFGLPWYRPTRINHITSGAEYGWRWGTGKWPAWFPDSLPATLNTGFASPTGLTFGTSSNWPTPDRDALYAADWQNGRILRVELTPQGASYQANATVFLEGNPLNVCDLEFGPDGNLYFITGGRGTQSGLYRVTRKTDAPAIAPSIPDAAAQKRNLAAQQARQTRRKLEAFHTKTDPAALDFIWSYLGSDDPYLKLAARIALENHPLDLWRQRVASEPDSPARHTALLALARKGQPVDQKIVLKGLAAWDWQSASDEELILALRILQLTMIRQGPINNPHASSLLRKLNRISAKESFPVRWLLAENLVALKDPAAIETILVFLESADTQEEAIQFAKTLTRIDQGWTSNQKKRFLDWHIQSRHFVGGKLLKSTLQSMRAELKSSLSDQELEVYADQLAALDAPLEDHDLGIFSQRPFVQEWKLEDLEADAAALQPEQRSLDNGKKILAEVLCLRCHRFGNRGGQIGPDLTAVGKRFDGRSLLESILTPSKVIDPKYRNSTYLLDDGRVVTGRTAFVSGQRIGVEVDPLKGTTVSFPRELLLESKISDVSPMPSGLLNTLTRDEILDLIAYLRMPER